VTNIKPDWGRMGPAMKRLPNDRWRAFVQAYVTDPKPGHGMQKRAYLAAGFKGNDGTARVAAHDMMRDERIIEAIAEESKKLLRVFYPQAQAKLFQIINDEEPASVPAQVRAIDMVLSRCDPVETKQIIDVTHRHVDPAAEELAQYRACVAMGADQQKLEAIFGYNGRPDWRRAMLPSAAAVPS
jgi:hypothetical protein